MSQQHLEGGLHISVSPDGPVFRRPANLDRVLDAALPSERELLSPHITMRDCSYVVCVEDDGQIDVSPEDKVFIAVSFGNLEGLGYEENHNFYPLTFDELVEAIRGQLNANAPRHLTIWATFDLSKPAERVSSDQHVFGAISEHFGLFRQYPLNYPVLYFFVEYARSNFMPSAGQFDEQFYVPSAPNNFEGGVSPLHVPEAPTGPEPSRALASSPEGSVPRAQPKRANTFQSGKKAVNKLTIAVKNAASTVKDLASPRATAEQRTVLTELASGIEEVDYLTSLLPSTFGSEPEYQEHLFQQFAMFYPHIDPNNPKQRENTRSINFRHTALCVTPHQACRAMQILFQDNATGHTGGLLASEMGSGKSIIILCSAVIRANLYQSKRVVEAEWEEVETRARSKKASSSQKAQRLEHLPRDSPKNRGLTCPTQRHRPESVLCYCVPDGATRNYISRLKPGATLITVPSAAMGGWIEILEGAIFQRMSYNVTVLYNGPPLSSRLQPGPDFLGGTRFNRWKMGAALPDGHPGGLITSTEELQWFAQPAPLLDTSKAMGPSMAMETYIVVQTHQGTRLRDLYSWSISDLSPAPQGCEFPPGGLYAFPVGITFIDEAHKVLEENSLPLQMVREHRSIHATPSATRPSDVWLVTGTPFGAQLKDLAAAVSLIVPDRADDAMALQATYEAIAPAMTNTPREMFEMLFDKVFQGQLVIRDDADTVFLGSRVSDTRNVRPQFISRNTPASLMHGVRLVIDTKVSRGPRDASFDTILKMKQNTELLYLLSMFPSAAMLLLESPNLAFTDLDTRRTIRKKSNTTGESLIGHREFQSVAEKLTRGPRSPKLQYILDELERMSKDSTPRPQSKSGASANVQSDLKLKKMVIITPTLFTALMLYVILARFHPRSGPLLFHEDLKQSQRQDVLRRFNSLHKREGPTRCFIAPASVASEALNLQIANRLILTSPLVDLQQERQALARVNRVGQCFDVELKILILEESPIDRIVIANRANARLENDPFNVDESVVVVHDE